MSDVIIAPQICINCLRSYAEPDCELCDSCLKDLEHGIISKGALKLIKTSTIKKYVVRADHPILRRPDKYGLTDMEADTLILELKRLNYENIRKDEL